MILHINKRGLMYDENTHKIQLWNQRDKRQRSLFVYKVTIQRLNTVQLYVSYYIIKHMLASSEVAYTEAVKSCCDFHAIQFILAIQMHQRLLMCVQEHTRIYYIYIYKVIYLITYLLHY